MYSCGKISGFNGFHNYRESKIGSGISIFVRSNFQCQSLGIDDNSDILECLGAKIYSNSTMKWVNIMGVYRPPATSIKN